MLSQLKAFFHTELKNWRVSEIVWLCSASLIILVLSIFWKDSPIGIVAAVTGVICVVLTGKGKLSSYLFGFVNVLLYAIVAFQAKYYGEVMLNLLYYLPMNFVGWFAWKKHLNSSTGEVEKKHLSPRSLAVLLGITAVCIYCYGWILQALGGNLPLADSMSTVVSVVAQILCVKRYAEQWILWILVDIVTVILWIAAFFQGGESIATLLMWSVYLVNAVIMFIRWNQETERSKRLEV